MKKILIIVFILCIFGLGGLFLTNKEEKIDINKISSFNFNTNIGFTESKISENPISKTKEQELTDLFGTPVTNKLGIPDVYLNLVANNIPESYEQARLAAIKMFYFDSLSLQALNKKDYKSFLINTYRWSAGANCLYFYVNNLKISIVNQDITISKSLPKLKKLNQQADNNLGGHVIHNDYGLNYKDNNYDGINDSYSSKFSDKYSNKNLCEYYINHQF